LRVLYGYPLHNDFSPQCTYGGDACPPGAPTHYCGQCCTFWHVADCPTLYYELPGSCYFCDHALTAKDRLAFAVAYAEWFHQDESDLKLSDGVFSETVYPVCAACRVGIRGNLDDLAEQDAQEERQRIAAVRLAIFGFIFFVVLGVYTALTQH